MSQRIVDGVPADAGNRWDGSGFVTQVLVLTHRALSAQLADRRLAVIRALQPLVVLVVFGQVFGSMVDTSSLPGGVGYIDYLLPAVLVTSGLGSAAISGAVLSRDMENGLMTRLRSLPIELAAVLFARSLAELLRTAVQSIILLGCAAAFFGFRPAGGVLGVLGALLLSLLVIWAIIWIFLGLSCWLRSLEVMQAVSSLATFPLTFASSAFAPLDGLPPWLRLVAQLNPMTYAIDATRALALATPAAGAVSAALLTAGITAGAAMVVAVRGFRRPPR